MSLAFGRIPIFVTLRYKHSCLFLVSCCRKLISNSVATILSENKKWLMMKVPQEKIHYFFR